MSRREFSQQLSGAALSAAFADASTGFCVRCSLLPLYGISITSASGCFGRGGPPLLPAGTPSRADS
jgi:hypothetical protein